MSKEKIEFNLVWNMPQIYFNKNPCQLYKRFYTRYFPQKEEEENQLDITDMTKEIVTYSFKNRNSWLKDIAEWRKPILNNPNLPKFYKCCLFNELYFLSDGGTIWIDNNEKNKGHLDGEMSKLKSDIIQNYGKFAYLEGHEYRMYNTYDVHFYASYALLKLWPKLQLSLQYFISKTIGIEDDKKCKFLYKGDVNNQKSRDTVPHDIGDPECEPFQQLNAYCLHDTKNWRDLNLKFILSIYRDYYYIKEINLLEDMWPLIKTLMITIESQDTDKDGLIDNMGNYFLFLMIVFTFLNVNVSSFF
jgi:non-lysosomal glucosylceramidase